MRRQCWNNFENNRLLRELGIIWELSAVFGIVPRFLSLGMSSYGNDGSESSKWLYIMRCGPFCFSNSRWRIGTWPFLATLRCPQPGNHRKKAESSYQPASTWKAKVSCAWHLRSQNCKFTMSARVPWRAAHCFGWILNFPMAVYHI